MGGAALVTASAGDGDMEKAMCVLECCFDNGCRGVVPALWGSGQRCVENHIRGWWHHAMCMCTSQHHLDDACFGVTPAFQRCG